MGEKIFGKRYLLWYYTGSWEKNRKHSTCVFYNLPIHGYVSIGMGAVSTLNDAVGGVEITLPADSQSLGLSAGTVVRLNGEQAYNFAHDSICSRQP
jgi:hypothetical protein